MSTTIPDKEVALATGRDRADRLASELHGLARDVRERLGVPHHGDALTERLDAIAEEVREEPLWLWLRYADTGLFLVENDRPGVTHVRRMDDAAPLAVERVRAALLRHEGALLVAARKALSREDGYAPSPLSVASASALANVEAIAGE